MLYRKAHKKILESKNQLNNKLGINTEVVSIYSNKRQETAVLYKSPTAKRVHQYAPLD